MGGGGGGVDSNIRGFRIHLINQFIYYTSTHCNTTLLLKGILNENGNGKKLYYETERNQIFKKSINHLMAVMDPSFVGPEAYDNFDSLRIRLQS